MAEADQSQVEELTPEQIEEQKTADVNKKLGNQEFVKFLEDLSQRRGEAIEDYNDDEILQNFETFNKMKEASKEISNLYKTEIFDQLGLTKEVLADATKCIEKYLAEQAADDPAAIERYVAEIKRYHENQRTITEMEVELQRIGERDGLLRIKAELQQKQAETDHDWVNSGTELGKIKDSAWNTAKKCANWVFRRGFRSKAEDAATAAHDPNVKKKKEIEEKLEAIDTKIQAYDQAVIQKNQISTEIDAMKATYLQALEPMEEIRQLMLVAAKKKIEENLNKTDATLKDINKAAELEGLYRGNEHLGDTFEDDDEAEQYETMIQEKMKEIITAEVKQSVDRVDAGKMNKIDKFGDFLNKMIKTEEAREMVKDALEETLDSLKLDPAKAAQRLFISRLLRTYFRNN
jgi:hypothetical protein